MKDIVFQYKEGSSMKLLLILGVIISFLTAIFTAGYEDKQGKISE